MTDAVDEVAAGTWVVPPTLGVLGGMGPAATVDFLARVVAITPATRDQDHVPTVVYSDPTTPDRSEAILAGGPDPLPALLRGITFLADAGCALVAIPCNTAHHWHEALQAACPVPVIHIAEAARTLMADDPRGVEVGTIGVLATDGTVRIRTYHDRLEEAGYDVIDLADDHDNPAMASIRALKAGDRDTAEALFVEAADRLVARGADGLVVGCTDLSVLCSPVPEAITVPVWDASDALARVAVSRMMGDDEIRTTVSEEHPT